MAKLAPSCWAADPAAAAQHGGDEKQTEENRIEGCAHGATLCTALTGGCGVRRGCGARHKLCLNEGGLFAYVKASFLQVKSFCNSTGMCVAFFIVCQLIRGAFRTD